jgi:hypothetical protein
MAAGNGGDGYGPAPTGNFSYTMPKRSGISIEGAGGALRALNPSKLMSTQSPSCTGLTITCAQSPVMSRMMHEKGHEHTLL